MGFNEFGLDLDDDETFNVASMGGLTIAHSIICNANNFRNNVEDPFDSSVFFDNANAQFPSNTGNLAIDAFPNCNLALGADLTGIAEPNYTPDRTSLLGSGGVAPAGSFFDRVTFRGAVAPGVQGIAGDGWWTWTRFD